MARPKKKQGEGRSRDGVNPAFRIRLTPAERERLDAVAKAEGMPTSTWARFVLLAREPVDLAPLKAKLKAVAEQEAARQRLEGHKQDTLIDNLSKYLDEQLVAEMKKERFTYGQAMAILAKWKDTAEEELRTGKRKIETPADERGPNFMFGRVPTLKQDVMDEEGGQLLARANLPKKRTVAKGTSKEVPLTKQEITYLKKQIEQYQQDHDKAKAALKADEKLAAQAGDLPKIVKEHAGKMAGFSVMDFWNAYLDSNTPETVRRFIGENALFANARLVVSGDAADMSTREKRLEDREKKVAERERRLEALESELKGDEPSVSFGKEKTDEERAAAYDKWDNEQRDARRGIVELDDDDDD